MSVLRNRAEPGDLGAQGHLQIALIAAFPELIDEYAKKRDGPRARAARLLSDRATDLTKAIARYRKALRAERAPPPDPIDCYF